MSETEGSESESSDESVEIFLEYDDGDSNVYDDDDEREIDNKTEEEFLTSEDRIRKMIEQKGMRLLGDETRWRESVRQQMESEINKRVREALETPPLERAKKLKDQARQQLGSQDLNEHLFLEPNRNREFMRAKRWRSVQDNKSSTRDGLMLAKQNEDQELHRSNPELSSTEFNQGRILEGITDNRDKYSLSINQFPNLKPKAHSFHTKKGYLRTLRVRNLPSDVQVFQETTTCVDKYGIVRNSDGPFWPAEFLPLFATPRFKWWMEIVPEPLHNFLSSNSVTVEHQVTQFKGKWRGVQIAYDSDRSPRDLSPLPVPEGCCPTLMFESRFECGNLRQARRVGQFDYELILKADLYTARHTQWYYFRVTNTVPGITYRLKIINLLKKDSLYNHGMRPLVYSDQDAREKQRGWARAGHHISYTRNSTNHNCPLLEKGVSYHTLEWQMEFSNANDTYYLAHCYPYSFTDLKEDLELLLNCEDRSKVTRREVMCETRAGNSCFLLTITNFDSKEEKTAVVVTARVHPGESQSSWMMKGLLEFITGQDPVAQKLRNRTVFKVVPMINPDGVIVGNYRCSLSARDLNRNYRHPRQENFPTIWNIKNMVQELAKKYQIALYCDLHGHNRKPNVFMYGNNTSTDLASSPQNMVRAFISERLFPWIMSMKSPDRFHFKSCKFHIRRCKESTGRVVMWRQMRVSNSFTMEATFSGTVLDREHCRHFNIRDYMEMGKILAQAVLEYQTVKEDPVKYTQTVLGLTQVITEQVLAARGLIKPDTLLPGSVHSGTSKNENVNENTSHKKWTESVLTLCKNSRDQVSLDRTSSEVKERLLEPNKDGNHKETSHDILSPVPSNEDVVKHLQKMANEPSLEDCVNLLAHLDVQNTVEESSSSDSDSESEPEMKPPEPKTRKKKRKSKQQRDKHMGKKMLASGEKMKADKSRVKSALPTLNATYRPGGNNSGFVGSDNQVLWQSKQTVSEKWRAGWGTSGFISKYEGRHNGGFPCFTEERSVERAAKRIAELRRKNQDTGPGEDSLYFSNERLAGKLEDLNQRLYNISDEYPNNSTTHLDSNFKTGYTHAEKLKEIYPDNLHPLNGGDLYLISTRSVQSPHHSNIDYRSSSTDGGKTIDKNSNDGHLHHALTARRTPYNQPDQMHPRSASGVELIGHSSISSNSAKSVKTTAASSTLSAVSHLSTTRNRLPHAATSPIFPGAINFSSSLIVNSLSKATSNTTKAPAIPAPTSSTNKSHDMPSDLKYERGDVKIDPVNLLRPLTHINKKGQVNLNDLTITNKLVSDNRTVDSVPDTQSDIVNGGNDLGYHDKQEKPPNVGQLVNHLAQNLSKVASPSPASKRTPASRNNHLRTLKSHQKMATTSTLTTSLGPSLHGISMDNSEQKTLTRTKLENRSGNVTDH